MYRVFFLDLDKIMPIISESSDISTVKERSNDFLKGNLPCNDGIIDGEKIIKSCFPSNGNDIKQENFHIFISHAHADEENVLKFTHFLEKELEIRSFVDSVVWEYCGDILKKIDDKYCKENDGYYCYGKRNYSTAHIHNMLLSSIAKVMDSCEVILFLATKDSIFATKDSIFKEKEDDLRTLSPWIYSELELTKILRVNSPARFNHNVALESFKVEYRIDLSNIPEIKSNQFEKWVDDYKEQLNNTSDKDKKESDNSKVLENPLDILYRIISN